MENPIDPNDFNVDLAGVSTARPVLADGWHHVQVFKSECRKSKSNKPGWALQFKCTEPQFSVAALAEGSEEPDMPAGAFLRDWTNLWTPEGSLEPFEKELGRKLRALWNCDDDGDIPNFSVQTATEALNRTCWVRTQVTNSDAFGAQAEIKAFLSETDYDNTIAG